MAATAPLERAALLHRQQQELFFLDREEALSFDREEKESDKEKIIKSYDLSKAKANRIASSIIKRGRQVTCGREEWLLPGPNIEGNLPPKLYYPREQRASWIFDRMDFWECSKDIDKYDANAHIRDIICAEEELWILPICIEKIIDAYGKRLEKKVLDPLREMTEEDYQEVFCERLNYFHENRATITEGYQLAVDCYDGNRSILNGFFYDDDFWQIDVYPFITYFKERYRAAIEKREQKFLKPLRKMTREHSLEVFQARKAYFQKNRGVITKGYEREVSYYDSDCLILHALLLRNEFWDTDIFPFIAHFKEIYCARIQNHKKKATQNSG